jgi:hypothetical protein
MESSSLLLLASSLSLSKLHNGLVGGRKSSWMPTSKGASQSSQSRAGGGARTAGATMSPVAPVATTMAPGAKSTAAVKAEELTGGSCCAAGSPAAARANGLRFRSSWAVVVGAGAAAVVGAGAGVERAVRAERAVPEVVWATAAAAVAVVQVLEGGTVAMATLEAA